MHIYSPYSTLRHLCSLVNISWSHLFGLTSVAHPVCARQQPPVIPFGLTSFAHFSMHTSISGLSLWSDFNHSSFSIHKYAYNPYISPCSQPRHLCSLVNNDQSYLFSLTSVAHLMCTRQLQLLVIPSGLTSVAHLSAQTSMQGMHTYPLVAYSGICAHLSTFSGHISSVSLQSLIFQHTQVFLLICLWSDLNTLVGRTCIYIPFIILRHLCSHADNSWPHLFGLTSVAHPQQSSQLWTATTFTSIPLPLLYHGHFFTCIVYETILPTSLPDYPIYPSGLTLITSLWQVY
jgi:hypothetical protein